MDKKYSSDPQNRRDSYDDRICNDLSEVLLNYLSVEDKLRLQCVSKRFQRTILVKNKLRHIVFDVSSVTEFVKVERMVKRLGNIQIEISGDYDDVAESSVDSNKAMLEHVIDSFGSRLVSLTTSNRFIMERQNLKENLRELKTKTFEDITGIEFKRLVKLEISHFINTDQDLYLFDKFVNKNNGITHLSFNYMVAITQYNYKIFMATVIKLTNLVHLKHGFTTFNNKLKRFETDSKLLAKECRHLKSVGLFMNNLTGSVDMSAIFEFSNLKRLHIDIMIDDSFQMTIFQSLSRLTHLTIKSLELIGLPLPETILKDIHFILPKLVSLQIYSRPIMASKMTGYRLSRLKKLETIIVTITNSGIANLITKRLIKNCKYVRQIQLEFN